jgi:Tol biopolymer transport system component
MSQTEVDPLSSWLPTRPLATIGAVVALSGAVVAVHDVATSVSAPRAVSLQDEPVTGRIAYTGTGHRSLGAVSDPVPDVLRPTEPLLGAGPAHHDTHVSARGDLVVFTSLRDEPRPQVYLRAADGSVRRLTEGLDAGHPRLSPDLRTVVFDSAGDLWLVGVDGGGLRRLTDTPSVDETWPTFAPDGARVAFSGDRDGAREIYRIPVGGGPVTRVTDEPAGDAVQPDWNPRDNRIAYTLDNGTSPQLRVLDGGSVGTPVLGGDQAGWRARWPAWKPDGTGLLFLSLDQVCTCTADPNVEKVYQVDTGPGLPVTAAPGLILAENRTVDSPTWLVDGRGEHLVVARTSAETYFTATLQDIRPDGSDPRDLGVPVLREDPESVNDPNLLFRPRAGFDPWTQRQSYSPDGRTIAVSRFEDVDGARVQRIWLVDADGSGARRLPVADRSPADWEFDAVWSPDGRFVAFARRTPGGVRPAGGRSRIVVVEVATGAVAGRLTPPPSAADQEDTQPAWSPDGGTVAFTRGRVFDGPTAEVRDNHVWTARAGTLDGQRDVSAAVCGFDCEVTDDSAAFSPDGRTLAFNREADGVLLVSLADDGCRVLLPAGTCSTPLTAPPSGPFQPRDVTFSPDGDHVVLTARRVGDLASPEELDVVDLATGEVDRITTDLPGRQKEPTWQQSVDLAVEAPSVTADVDTGVTTSVTVTVVDRGPADSPGTVLTVAVPEGVRLAGLRPALGRCDVAELRCDLGVVEAGRTVEIVAELVGVVPGRRSVTWSVAGAVLDAAPSDNATATAVPVRDPVSGPPPPLAPPAPPVAGPSLAVVVQPNPSYVGGRATVSYTVRNGGGGLATGLRLDFELPAQVPVATLPPGCANTGCALPDLAPGASQVVQVVLAPNVPLQTTVRGTLRTTGTDADPADNVAAAPMRVLQPRIVAVPPIGEPGFVTSVRGVDFPPGVPVRLAWSPGITPAAAPTIPRPDGGFTAQLLILAKDQTGPRTITATGSGFRADPTPFLVVPGSVGPPDMVRRR